jgi:para-aminobenzoate synthetase component 2
MNILLVDNHDSFTYNLVDLLRTEPDVFIDVLTAERINLTDVARYDRIIFSPGPGLPAEHPIMHEILRRYDEEIPILGVCLGMQSICEYYGGELIHLPQVVHGQQHVVEIVHAVDILAGLPTQTKVGLYHSWAIRLDRLPESVEMMAVSQVGVLMAVRHRTKRVYGVQFHPESHLSTQGEKIMHNFLYRV